MENLQQFTGVLSWFIPVILICAVWDAVWKLIGMWRAGRNNDLAWFICIAIFITLGILPIIYLLLGKNNRTSEKEQLGELPKEYNPKP